MCLWMCMSFCQWAFQAYFVEGHVFVNVYVLLSVSLPSLLRRKSCVCECVCPSVSEPSKLTSSKVMYLWMCMSFCQWAFQAYFVEGHVFVNVYVLLSVSLPSLLRRRSCVCECVCPSVSEPSKLTSSKVMCLWMCMSFCQWAFQAYFVEGHVFVNVYVLLSVSLSSLLRRRSCVCECVCPFVSEPSKLTSSKVMYLWMCMSFCQWAFQAYFVEGHVFVNVYVLLSVSLPSLLRRRSCVCECVCPSVSEPSKLTSSKVMCLWMCMSFCQWAFQAYFVEGHVFVNVYVLLSVSLSSLLRRRSCVCECVCPFVSEPSKLTSSKVMYLWMCMSFSQWAFQAYFVEGHVFVNVYVLLSVSLPSLLRRRSCVCECVCPFVSEPSKLTSSKVMCLWMCMSFVSEPSKLTSSKVMCLWMCMSFVSEPSKLTSSKVMCLWMCMSFCQ